MLSLLGTDWARKPGNDGKPLGESDVKSAMKGWNRLGALRPREQLEDRLQWNYGPSAKRNGRKQADHLAIARDMKSILVQREGDIHKGGPSKKCDLIREYAAAHPEANHSEIARNLGVSRPTVIKWLKPGWQDEWAKKTDVCGDGARSGNHNPRKGL